MWNFKMNMEEIWDYSYELLHEINQLISKLPESKFISSNQFIDIKNKLDKAKSLWMNVQKYEDQIYDFRWALLKRKILNKIDKIEDKSGKIINNQSKFDISAIESNFEEFKNDYQNFEEIEKLFLELLKVLTYEKISHMIEQYASGVWSSYYDFEKILKEMNEAEAKWVDIKELKMKILWD